MKTENRETKDNIFKYFFSDKENFKDLYEDITGNKLLGEIEPY